jgi:DNA-directed RNA polymerase specialized sigma24 family protein
MAIAAESQAKRAEIERTFLGLGDADLLRLQRFAQLRARLVPAMEWRDLLQEAIARALDGRRKCPRSIDFMAFMRQTIRSIANEHVRREERKPAHTDFDDEQLLDRSLNSARQPERLVAVDKLLQEIHALFAGDPEVLAVISGLAADESPREIQDRSGMSATQYASAQKRIRRGLARAFPDGGVGS